MRGEPAGDRTDSGQDASSAGERGGITRWQPKQQRLDELHRPDADAGADRDADADEPGHTREGEADDATRTGALWTDYACARC
jgi:hypothetical protein